MHQVEGHRLVRMFTQPGAGAPLHCTGVGKALLAWRPPQEVARLLGNGPYPAYTPRSAVTLDALQAELQRVREQGYSLDDEEREPGVRCLAAPLRGGGGSVVAALSVSAPVSRFGEAQVAPFAAALLASAAQVEARLGGPGEAAE